MAMFMKDEMEGACMRRMNGLLLPPASTQPLLNTMKNSLLLLPFALLTLAALPACREKTTGEKIGGKIDDALDQRPGEKIRDAVEDAKE